MDALRQVRMGLYADAQAHAARGISPARWAERVIGDPGVRKLYRRYASPERFAKEIRAIIWLVYGV